MKKTLKTLADAYFFENANISQHEYNALKSSKYARIFNHKPFKPGVIVERVNPQYPRQMSSNVGIQRLVIRELVDYVEAQLGMDLSKPLHNKYANIELEQLKELISTFEAENVMNGPTKSYISSLLSSDSVESVFYNLYSH